MFRQQQAQPSAGFAPTGGYRDTGFYLAVQHFAPGFNARQLGAAGDVNEYVGLVAAP